MDNWLSKAKQWGKIHSSMSRQSFKIGSMETWKISANRLGEAVEIEDVLFQQDKNESCASTYFPKLLKSLMADLREHLERWNIFVKFCFSSVVSLQNLTSAWSGLICYLYLSTDETLNHWLCMKPTTMSF